MELLKSSLLNFFKTNKNLKNFLPRFKEIIDHDKIFLKNEYIKGTYFRDIVFRNNDFEIVLITWGAKSSTDIHCHPKNGCILTVIDGSLIEEKYDHNNILYEKNNLKRKDFGYMHCDYGKHKIINNHSYNCYSLHIYSPPGFYD